MMDLLSGLTRVTLQNCLWDISAVLPLFPSTSYAHDTCQRRERRLICSLVCFGHIPRVCRSLLEHHVGI